MLGGRHRGRVRASHPAIPGLIRLTADKINTFLLGPAVLKFAQRQRTRERLKNLGVSNSLDVRAHKWNRVMVVLSYTKAKE